MKDINLTWRAPTFYLNWNEVKSENKNTYCCDSVLLIHQLKLTERAVECGKLSRRKMACFPSSPGKYEKIIHTLPSQCSCWVTKYEGQRVTVYTVQPCMDNRVSGEGKSFNTSPSRDQRSLLWELGLGDPTVVEPESNKMLSSLKSEPCPDVGNIRNCTENNWMKSAK